MGYVLSGVALVTWWLLLLFFVHGQTWLFDTMGFMFKQYMEGPMFLGSMALALSMGSLLLEGSLRRRRLRWRMLLTGLSGGITFFGFMISYPIWQYMLPVFTGDGLDPLVADSNLVTLRFRLPLWLLAGFWSGIAPFLIRRFHHWSASRWGVMKDSAFVPPLPTWLEWVNQLFSHVAGAVVAASFGAAVWHLFGHDNRIAGDLYWASALGPMVWGFLYGVLVWPIPDDLYAGWMRVLSSERYGLRIPIPHADGSPAERFVGHFPRGLDMYLPADQAVAELHISFIVDGNSRYAVRGLSIQPTQVKRFLERVDLRYDPRRPAPLETELKMEDRILLGPNGETVVEFIMLPKEER